MTQHKLNDSEICGLKNGWVILELADTLALRLDTMFTSGLVSVLVSRLDSMFNQG